MRLNLDCIRDTMLWVENLTTPTRYVIYLDTDELKRVKFLYLNEDDIPAPNDYQAHLSDKYSNEVLVYHLNYCIEAGLLKPLECHPPHITIQDLTPLGHEFIGNIRKPEIFSNVKNKVAVVGIQTVKSVINIAEKVAADYLSNT